MSPVPSLRNELKAFLNFYFHKPVFSCDIFQPFLRLPADDVWFFCDVINGTLKYFENILKPNLPNIDGRYEF